MRKYGIKADKSMGQHFLIDQSPLMSMIKAAELSPDDEVLEIGPGLGVLTLQLCKKVKQVVAVEKDRQLIPVLHEMTRDFKNICVFHEDVLKLNMENFSGGPFEGKFKVVANLPYYITSPIIMKIIENRRLISMAVLMVQKEVAQRLVASPGRKDYGILSIAVQIYTDVEMVCTIGKNSFLPPPKVESAVVKIIPKQKPRVDIDDELMFFRVVKSAFGERRKTLRNSLKRRLVLPGITPYIINEVLEEVGIDPMRRGETLSIEEFAKLTKVLQRHIVDKV